MTNQATLYSRCSNTNLTWLLALLVFLSVPVSADKYDRTLEAFQNADGTEAFFDTAYGYALFPSIKKGGFIVGGARGKGRVFTRGEYVGNVIMTQGTIGFQAGGQAFSQIVFFEDERAFREFSSGNFEVGAQATAVGVTAGVSAEASTGGGSAAGVSTGQNDSNLAHAGYRKGLAIFTIAKGGLMAEAAVGGQKFKYKPLVVANEE